jgi:hypothetical protein
MGGRSSRPVLCAGEWPEAMTEGLKRKMGEWLKKG